MQKKERLRDGGVYAGMMGRGPHARCCIKLQSPAAAAAAAAAAARRRRAEIAANRRELI